MGNMVLSSALIVYIGPFDENNRKKLMSLW